jgi:hypothetical protein
MKLFCDARHTFPEQAVRIKGIIFFGTPHTTTSTNVEDSLFAKMAESNNIDVNTMNLVELNQISEHFLEESAKATDVKFVSFYEAGTGSKIVGRDFKARQSQAHHPCRSSINPPQRSVRSHRSHCPWTIEA